jgi:DNA-binding transcriptional LysR family regulator
LDISSGGIETGALIVRRLRRTRPELAIEQVEVSVRRGIEMLRRSELDAVLGIVEDGDPGVRVELVRREPVLVAMSAGHPLAARDEVPVAGLADVELLLPSQDAAAEWVGFVYGFCRDAGVEPRRWAGVTHGSVSAAEVLREGTCVTPTAAWTEPLDGLAFRPLVDPVPLLPWSLAWRAGDDRPEVAALVECAREAAREHGWR